MKNKERYQKEIVEIVCNCEYIAVDKETERPVVCNGFDCDKCMFRVKGNCRSRYLLKEWAESEYIEKPVISKKDKAFLEYLGEEFKYIVRHKDGTLFAYKDGLTNWLSLNCRFDVDFPMVKWEGNEEIWLIEDLKKLEVVEDYGTD